MEIILSFNGGFPRDEKVAKIHSMRNSGELDESEFMDLILQRSSKLIQGLKRLNYAILTDGLYWYDDILNPVIRNAEGIEVNGLRRFFDNNFFVRVPVIKGEIKYRDAGFAQWLKSSVNNARKVMDTNQRIKAVLPGPLTLTYFSEKEQNTSLKNLLQSWSKGFLIESIRIVEEAGYDAIELHEPALVAKDTSEDLVVEALSELKELASTTTKPIFVIIYFGSFNKKNSIWLKKLSDNVTLFIDPFKTRTSVLKRYVSKGSIASLGIGVINARNPLPESFNFYRKWMELAEELGVSELFFGNNAPMDFIPPRPALSKLKKLSRFRREVLKA